MKVVLNNKVCCVEFNQYADNNNVAIQIVKKCKGQKENELVATATVNTEM